LGIEITETKFKPLTTKDVALGIGRKFTKDELDEYLQRTAGGKPKSIEKAKKDLIAKLRKKTAK